MRKNHPFPTQAQQGEPHIKRSYAGSAGETWYVLYAFNQFNGEAIALHSGTTAYPGQYPGFEASMCVDAIALPFTVARYEQWWQSYNATFNSSKTSNGMPDLLPAMVMQPTHNATGVADWLRSFPASLYGWNVHERVGDADEGTDAAGAGGGACNITEIMAYTDIQNGAQAEDPAVLSPIRFVQSTARTGDLSVRDYVRLVDRSIHTWTGQNAGYSRWMDNHVALGNTDARRPIDALQDWFMRHDVPWHAHYTEMSSDDDQATTLGSAWTAGISGLAIELHGSFNFTAIHDPVGQLDYCTKTSSCRRQDVAQCKFVTGLVSSIYDAVDPATSPAPGVWA